MCRIYGSTPPLVSGSLVGQQEKGTWHGTTLCLNSLSIVSISDRGEAHRGPPYWHPVDPFPQPTGKKRTCMRSSGDTTRVCGGLPGLRYGVVKLVPKPRSFTPQPTTKESETRRITLNSTPWSPRLEPLSLSAKSFSTTDGEKSILSRGEVHAESAAQVCTDGAAAQGSTDTPSWWVWIGRSEFRHMVGMGAAVGTAPKYRRHSGKCIGIWIFWSFADCSK